VAVIRPAKGLDPQLYECLASTFRQSYPKDKLTIRFCVASRDDAAFPILEKLIHDFQGFDAKILVEEEDPLLQHGSRDELHLGPNPKIRSMSRAYREAKGDVIWIIDCNVWVAPGVCGRMVDKMFGRGPHTTPRKLVHQMPLVVDIDDAVASTSTNPAELSSRKKSVLQTKGGRLEEMFMSSSHAKFYTAINTVLIAPCLVGKSNMFRKSHLDSLTKGEGIDYFSHNICEDHLIGDLLWKQPVPRSVLAASTNKNAWGNHAMLFGDIVIQPMANMRVSEYIARRVRWLRVRKYTVPAATGVEPTTESFLCSAMLSYGLTSLPYAHEKYNIPQTWSAFAAIWLLLVASWATVDWTLYKKIHSAVSIAQDEHTPSFARPAQNGGARRPLKEWLMAWLGREALAFPIWFWAIFGGATVNWRGKSFWVGMDMRVHAIEEKGGSVGNGVLDRRKAE
jgi:ceramide glucosyltransferase